MTIVSNNDALVTGELETTDASWHTICSYGLGGVTFHYYSIVYGSFVYTCRKPDNSACAFWEQPICFKVTDTTATLLGSLPALLSTYKPIALLACDVDYVIDGETISLMVKGLNETTLKWGASFNLNLCQHDD